jgi:hypothetical protein
MSTYIMLIEALRLLVQATSKYHKATWEVWTVHEEKREIKKVGGWGE